MLGAGEGRRRPEEPLARDNARALLLLGLFVVERGEVIARGHHLRRALLLKRHERRVQCRRMHAAL